MNKSIVFAFISPISPESHKILCTLCLNEYVKKSKLIYIVNKLYTEDMISSEEMLKVE